MQPPRRGLAARPFGPTRRRARPRAGPPLARPPSGAPARRHSGLPFERRRARGYRATEPPIEEQAGRRACLRKLEAIADLIREVQEYAGKRGDEDLERMLRVATAVVEDDPAHSGKIELIIGSMATEKTTEMIRRVRQAAYAATPAVIVKYAGDTRYEKGAIVASHAEVRQATAAGSDARAPIRIVVAATLAEAELDEDEMVIGVDEGQFFPDLIPQCEAWAAEGRRVIVAALDGDFARRPFGQVCDLVPRCEEVVKLRGVCMTCRGRESAFTQRIGPSTELVEIGGRESYRSVCRQCYFTRK